MNSQLPLGDATWTKVQYDDFNNTTLSSQWITTYPWGAPVNNGEEYNSVSNLLLNYNSGFLSIKCETTTPIYYAPLNKNYNYKSGVITSTFTTKYGYFEIAAKMPIGYGFWPAFWLYAQNGCEWYNEIDIAENGGFTNISADEMGYNYLWAINSTTCMSCTTCSIGMLPITTPPFNVSGNTALEHKYAMFWEPGRMTWFYDDQPLRTITDTTYTPNHAMHTIINFALFWNIVNNLSPGFPKYFEINYINIWQLNTDCGSQESYCGNFNATTYNASSKVKQTITIGGSSCSDNINTSDNVNFWATDYVLLDAGTIVTANGSGAFSINLTPCPN